MNHGDGGRRRNAQPAGLVAGPLFLSLLFLIVGASAQGTEPTVSEDFQDDTVGSNPTGTWYTLTETTTAGQFNGNVGSILSTQAYGGQKQTTDTTFRTATFNINGPGQASYVEFRQLACNVGSGQAGHRFSLLNSDGQTISQWTTQVSTSCDTNQRQAGNYALSLQPAGCTGSSSVASNAGIQVWGHIVNLAIDWDANTVTLTVPTGTTPTASITCPFMNSATELAAIRISDAGSTNRKAELWTDSITIGNISPTSAPEESDTVNPVHQAKEYFDDSWNLPTGASNWLFGIAIVGFIVVGFAKYRNPMVTVFSVLAGVGLAVAFDFFELWVLLLLAFLIIAFATRSLFGANGEAGTE